MDLESLPRHLIRSMLREALDKLESMGVDTNSITDQVTVKDLAEWLHQIFCNSHEVGNPSCEYYREGTDWSQPYHTAWLNAAREMSARCGPEKSRQQMETVYMYLGAACSNILKSKDASVDMADLIEVLENWHWMSILVRHAMSGKEKQNAKQLAGADEKGVGGAEAGG